MATRESMITAIKRAMYEIAGEPIVIRADADFDTTDIKFVGRTEAGVTIRIILERPDRLHGD